MIVKCLLFRKVFCLGLVTAAFTGCQAPDHAATTRRLDIPSLTTAAAPDISFINGTWCGDNGDGGVLTFFLQSEAGTSFSGTFLNGPSCGVGGLQECLVRGRILASDNLGFSTYDCSGPLDPEGPKPCVAKGQINGSKTTITGTAICPSNEGLQEFPFELNKL